ncbi:MAG: ParB/RepB/Spo0J family partition protein [bacterium]|nr:ParB/RepB/Spo0J family partition protein [bacterium]
MSAPKRGLGRGLEALLPDPQPRQEVAVADIRLPGTQPRERFAEEGIASLSASIRHHGILQPLVVSEDGDGFRLIAGERRLRAAKAAGLSHVPVFIRSDEAQRHFELALIENLQRSDLSPLEEAQAFERLLAESELSQEGLAKRLGIGRSKIALAIRLLTLPVEARRALEEGKISAGHAQAVLAAAPERREVLLGKIIAEGLSVRAAERAAKGSSSRPASTPQPAWVTDLSRNLGARIAVRGNARRGSLTISYHSAEELEAIVERLRSET